MCIAIVKKPTGKHITKKRLKLCYDANPDSAGFAYIEKGRIKIEKYLHFTPFYKALRTAEKENPSSNFLIHFRIKTHGKIDIDNCHPFQINNNLCMIHNGIIHNVKTDKDKSKSDTRHFIEQVLHGLPNNFYLNPSILKMMGSFIGYSKLAFLDSKNQIRICNPDKGEWDGDNWYSNKSYLPPVAITPPAKNNYKWQDFQWNTKNEKVVPVKTPKSTPYYEIYEVCDWCNGTVRANKAKDIFLDDEPFICCDACFKTVKGDSTVIEINKQLNSSYSDYYEFTTCL